MKKCNFNSFFIKLVLALMVMPALISVSCKSSPPTPEEVVTVVEQAKDLEPSLGDLNQVDAARKRAMDFEAPAYFPSEWEAAEAQYDVAKHIPTIEGQQTSLILGMLAKTYDDLFKRTIPLYTKAWEDEIISIRDDLIATGLRELVPEYVENADKMTLTALEQFEAEDYYTARDTAEAALEEYETLYLGARVFLRRQEIVDRGFIVYDPETFDKADDIADAAIDKFDEGDKIAAREGAEEAMSYYNILLANGWKAYATEQNNSASSERESAISHKVNIAAREHFREADAIFTRARVSFDDENYEDAATLFTEADALFVIAGQETEEKRRRAHEAIRIAEEKIVESVEVANEAERIIEGGSR